MMSVPSAGARSKGCSVVGYNISLVRLLSQILFKSSAAGFKMGEYVVRMPRQRMNSLDLVTRTSKVKSRVKASERPKPVKSGNEIVGYLYPDGTIIDCCLGSKVALILKKKDGIVAPLKEDGSVIEDDPKSTEAPAHKDGIAPLKEIMDDDE